MFVLYCLDPLDRQRPDDAFAAEVLAADRLTIPWALIDHDAIVAGNVDRAIRRVPSLDSPTMALYRGWMMRPEEYHSFYAALLPRGVHLINDPAAYRHCHYLPESYVAIEQYTPRSVWLPVEQGLDMNRVFEVLRIFGSSAVIVKDYVKSQKHAWEEACYVPSASDCVAVQRVVRRFLDLQGSDLAGGLVFRKFIEFEPVGQHPQSGMPLTQEYRLFFLDGQLIFQAEYWEVGEYSGEVPPVEHFAKIAVAVQSRFFTMDVAKKRDGGWMIIELGDGQVAGLPERADPQAFYRSLLAAWPLA